MEYKRKHRVVEATAHTIEKDGPLPAPLEDDEPYFEVDEGDVGTRRYWRPDFSDTKAEV
jgi:hypothetical protein